MSATRTDNVSVQAQKEAVALAVSSLLGGLGSFRGKLLVPRRTVLKCEHPEDETFVNKVNIKDANICVLKRL